MKARLSGVARAGARIEELESRVRQLESDLAEQRENDLRLAEIADLVQELLVPLASRDQEVVDRAIASFQRSL